MENEKLKTMHLFAGGGGGLYADLILGHQPVVAVEWEPYACQILRERRDEGWFPGLHVWEGDVRLFDPSEYAGKVDCIHAGFPCQDISVAGKQAGVGEETRSGLYREVIRIADVVRPRYLFLENVSAIVTNGLDTVLSDLATFGYDAEWLCLRASDCGAQHHRDRWWLLAHTRDSEGWNSQPGVSGGNGERKLQEEIRACETTSPARSGKTSEVVADTKKLQRNGSEHHGENSQSQIPEPGNGGGSGDISNTNSLYAQGEQSGRTDTEERQEQGERQVRSQNAGDSGFWCVEPSVGRVVDGLAHRKHRLQALGNGQVPIQAAVAWKLLGGE